MVQHFVSLVEDEHLDVSGAQVATTDHIEHTAWRSNNDVLQYFMHKGLSIESFNEVYPSLNDIFIRLVQDTSTAREFQDVK